MAEQRVKLAPLREADLEPMFEWINDRDLVLLSSAFEPVDEASHRAWFDSIRARDDVEIFGIRTTDDKLIGSCQLLEIDRRRGSAKLQIRIGAAPARDRGLGTEAVILLLSHAFEDLGLHRVELDVFATNERAIRAYEKAGMRREGVRREAVEIDGEPVDVVAMAIVRGEPG